MPGAIQVPYSSLSDPNNRFKSVRELREIFLQQAAGIFDNTNKRIVLSCGSGVSVCNLYLALEECGVTASIPTAVYDGSWEEWKSVRDVPKVVPEKM
jgi:thiosulfate/3-mercaptopyruvate sulfurtransferase